VRGVCLGRCDGRVVFELLGWVGAYIGGRCRDAEMAFGVESRACDVAMTLHTDQVPLAPGRVALSRANPLDYLET
jgi:hypothetical protein